MSLPDPLDPIGIENRISANDGHVVSQALSGKHTIKGITVMKWKGNDVRYVADFHLKKVKSIDFHLSGNELIEGPLQFEFAEARLDADFPK